MVNVNVEISKYYGKYRATLQTIMDPDGLGRIRAKVRLLLEEKELGMGYALCSICRK